MNTKLDALSTPAISDGSSQGIIYGKYPYSSMVWEFLYYNRENEYFKYIGNKAIDESMVGICEMSGLFHVSSYDDDPTGIAAFKNDLIGSRIAFDYVTVANANAGSCENKYNIFFIARASQPTLVQYRFPFEITSADIGKYIRCRLIYPRSGLTENVKIIHYNMINMFVVKKIVDA